MEHKPAKSEELGAALGVRTPVRAVEAVLHLCDLDGGTPRRGRDLEASAPGLKARIMVSPCIRPSLSTQHCDTNGGCSSEGKNEYNLAERRTSRERGVKTWDQ